MRSIALYFLVVLGGMSACAPTPVENSDEPAALRLASFHGTATELLFAMGLGDQIVVRDVTSTYPEAAGSIPTVGHPSQIGVEPVLAYMPDLVVCTELVKPEVRSALEEAGVELLLLPNPDTPQDGIAIVNALAERLGVDREAHLTHYACLESDRAIAETAPSALFIYGHSGNSGWMVAGSETAVSGVLSLGGFRNPAAELSGYQPLTPEALVAWNPDYIVLFDHTFEAAGRIDGLLLQPGIAEVTAGAKQQFLHFPGQAMNGFGLQTCKIIERLQQISTPS